ncbi:Kelch repeat-containing protein [Algibacter mikhailovii]|nr:kelch repeat-containing protein [Algibacter mikhailovii]
MKLMTSFLCFLLTSPIVMSQTEVSLGSWETIKTINAPLARHECSFVNVGDAFYLLGGRGVKPVSIYDVKTNTWRQGSEPPIEIHHFQAVAYKGQIYMFGAMTGKYPYETPLPNILIYNPKKDIWRTGPEIPEGRRRGSAGVVIQNKKAYIVSGIVDGHNSTHVPWVDSYDFETGNWEVLADAPRPRDHFHAAIKNGKIYAVGGRNSSFATKQTFELTIPEVDVYNINTNSWTTLPKSQNLNVQRAGTSCVFLGNDLVLIGGESSSQKVAHNEVDAYNIETKLWQPLNHLNRGRHGSQAIVYDDKIYIVAGSGNRGGSPELVSLEMFVMNK